MNKEQLPDVLTVRDIQQYLGIGINQAYQLVNSGQFHIVRVGNLIRIDKSNFLRWLEGESTCHL